MNVPRDYESLFNNAVNNITVLIDWAPSEAAKNQLSYTLCGLKAGYRIAKEGFTSLKAEPPQPRERLEQYELRPAVNLWPPEDAFNRVMTFEVEPPQPAQQFMFCGTYVNTGCEQPITCDCLCCAKHCQCIKKVEPPKGANSGNPEKVSKTLDFLGRWKTRGGLHVEIHKYQEDTETWFGITDDLRTSFTLQKDGKHQSNSAFDLMDRVREAPKFANG